MTRQASIRQLMAGILTAVGATSTCLASTIYDTTPSATTVDFDISPTLKQATQFRTTASDFVVTGMTFELRQDSETPAAGSLNWLIYTDDNGLPNLPIAGNPIFNMSVAGLTGTYSAVSTGSLNVALSPSTTYWLVLNGQSLDSGVLQIREALNPTGTGGPFKAASYPVSSGTWTGNAAVAAFGTITAVPEPMTAALLAVGVPAAIVCVALRRRW